MQVINTTQVVESSEQDLYQYVCYVKSQPVVTNKKSSYWYLNKKQVGCFTGTGEVFEDFEVCVELLGYTPESRTSSYTKGTDLPYLNGCSTKQLIPAVRNGDPTWQLLKMSPCTTEQKHHVHSTARVVYVVEGSGKSIVGMPDNQVSYDLKQGMVLVLDKMEAHHFESGKEGLLVAPFHVFSSGSNEFNHPMFNGTHLT
jgi:mannose-6-phosphate isomerase-like protein (cupin superfamily)